MGDKGGKKDKSGSHRQNHLPGSYTHTDVWTR